MSTVEEIRLIAALACQRHQIGIQQEHIIVGAIKLSKMAVKEVMIPFSEMVSLSSSMQLNEALELAHIDAHTRFPVCENDDKNNIIGYVNFKEIVSHQRLNPYASEFKEIIRPITFVDSNSLASDLLRRFTLKHEHIAIVRDAGGNCVGMVTLEDIVEELVGEIEDEFDRLPQYTHVLPNQVLLIGGGCLMQKVKRVILKEFGNSVSLLPNELENVDAQILSRWIESKLQSPPKRGNKIVCGDLEFNVRRVRRFRVFDVQIQRCLSSGSVSDNQTKVENVFSDQLPNKGNVPAKSV